MPSISRAAAPVPKTTYTLHDIIQVSRLYPQLWLNVSAKPDGVHLVATIVPARGDRETRNRTILKAVWQPEGVTEQLVVEWAYRALRKALEDHYDGVGHL